MCRVAVCVRRNCSVAPRDGQRERDSARERERERKTERDREKARERKSAYRASGWSDHHPTVDERIHWYSHPKREQVTRFYEHLPEIQGQNLALTVLYVAYLLDSSDPVVFLWYFCPQPPPSPAWGW